jgi:hypothetical protein
VIVPLAAEGAARVEVAVADDDRGRAVGPMVAPAPSPSEGLGEPVEMAIHPLRVIPAHPWLPKIAAKGSAQRCDGVT